MKGPMESTKYFLLVALAAGPKHGMAIREQMVSDTMGIYLRDSTLYDALKSLIREGLIEQLPSPREYRKPYRLTEKGARLLAMEARLHKRGAELVVQRLRFR